MKKVAFYTLGCKLNYAETSSISRSFEDRGYLKVSFQDNPDVFVINTCSVTDHADRKCKKLVRDARKISPEAKIAVIGCYAQLRPEEIAAIPGVDIVLGAAQKFNIVDQLDNLDSSNETMVHCSDVEDVIDFEPSHSQSDRTRTFLKVQDGCDYKCSFCTIPKARGGSRSAPIDFIVTQARDILKQGTKEIVLTGVNLGDFGLQKGQRVEDFFTLAKELERIEGDHRFRISSIEPNLLSTPVIELVAGSEKFAPHFHIPLQSGSNKILRAMARRYDRKLYQDRVEQILSLVPNACIGVDVIVGFPGEGEAEFAETLNFLKDLEVSYLHVFTYSERPGTKATGLGSKVRNEIRTQRSQMLRILSQKKRRQFYQRNQGQMKTVLFEERAENGTMQGFTENYIKIQSGYNAASINQLVQIKLGELNSNGTVSILESIGQLA